MYCDLQFLKSQELLKIILSLSIIKDFRMSSVIVLVVICFYSTDGVAASSLRVVIEGVNSEQLDNINAFLKIKAMTEDRQSAEAIEYWFRKAPNKINTALRALGYYAPEIKSELDVESEDYIAKFFVSAGEPVLISNVDLIINGEGRADKNFIKIISDAKALQGKKLNHAYYELIKGSLSNYSVAMGYFDAEFIKKELRVNPDTHQAFVEIIFDSGKRYLFGNVQIAEGKLDKKFIRKFIPFEYGDFYNSEQIIKLRSRLLSSQYFESVSVRRGIKPQGNERHWPVIIEYKTKKRDRYDYGVGYGTDSGVRVSFVYSNRLATANGHRYKYSASISETVNKTGFEYMFPDQDPLNDIYSFSIDYEREELDISISEKYSAGIQRRHVKEGDWTRIVYLKYIEERFSVADDSGCSTLLTPGISWLQSKSNSRIRPTKGWRASLDLFGAYEDLLSDLSFLQLRSNFKYIFGLGEDVRLIGRGEFGGTYITDEDFSQLPPSLRFFAGGDNSVRGYPFKTLSQFEDGEAAGGRYILTGSMEVEYQFIQDWGVVAFIDMGNAFESFQEKLYTGRGIGVRWFSPVGPLRLDFAWPEAGEAKDFRIHISIGPDL